MLARRLLAGYAGGASSGVAPEVVEYTAAPDGAWCWFGDPRAVTYAGHTYLGYVDTSGNVCVRVYVHASQTVGAEIVLHAALDIDDHANPSFLVRASDHRLMAWYARHEPLSTTMHQRISVTSLDTDPTLADGFAAETDTDAQMGSDSYDYPVPFQLSSEGGRIRMYYRNIPYGSDYQLTQSESTDDGATWSGRDAVYRSNNASGRGYWKIVSDGVSKIHFALTDESPNTGTTHLGHAYFDAADGLYHHSDGTAITLRGLAPLDVFWFADATPVYTAANTWVWDIALDGTTPVILHPRWATEFSDVRYMYSRWTGAAWTTSEICAAGAGIDATGVYSGGMCFDHADPTTVYASRQVSGQWEMYRYRTTDSGATWSATALTAASAAKNIRPYVPGGAGAPSAIWLYGTYTGYRAFDMGIRGIR